MATAAAPAISRWQQYLRCCPSPDNTTAAYHGISVASLLREVPCRKSLALHHRLGATVQASLWHFSPKMAMDCYAQLMVLMPLLLPLPLLLLLLQWTSDQANILAN